MIAPDVQSLASQLQQALGLSIVCGSVTLNFNNGTLEAVKTETYQRVTSRTPLDKAVSVRA